MLSITAVAAFAERMNDIMLSPCTATEQVDRLCQCFVDGIPAVSAASVMLTDLRAQQAVVCGAHVGTDATEHLKLRLVTVESEQWSALTPPVAAREVLMCQNGCGDGLMDDHALLAESCPDLRHFATFAIAGGPANNASNVLLTVTLASEHADFGQRGPQALDTMRLLQSLLTMHTCSSSLLAQLREILAVLQSTCMSELAETVLALYRAALRVTVDYRGALALALVPGSDSECLSVYSLGTERGPLTSMLPEGQVPTSQGGVSCMQSMGVKLQGSLLMHCLQEGLDNHVFENISSSIMTTRDLDACDVIDLVDRLGSSSLVLSFLKVNDDNVAALYLTGEAGTDYSAQLAAVRSLAPVVSHLFVMAIQKYDFNTDASGDCAISEASTQTLPSLLSISSLRRSTTNFSTQQLAGMPGCSSGGYAGQSAMAGPGSALASGTLSDSQLNFADADLAVDSASAQMLSLVSYLQTTIGERYASTASYQDQLEELDIGFQLGYGGYSWVYAALYCGQPVAVKVTMLDDPASAQTIAVAMATELAILKTANHPNIPTFFHVIDQVPLRAVLARISNKEWYNTTRDKLHTKVPGKPVMNEDSKCCVLIMEHCSLGSMSRALTKNVFHPIVKLADGRRGKVYNRAAILQACLDIAHALQRIHSMGVIHCDLKPSNLLLVCRYSSQGRSLVTVKLADFGLSKILPPGKTSMANSNIGGTIAWAAPECLVSKWTLTTAVDLYSFGLIMWQFVTGQTPWRGVPAAEVATRVVNDRARPTFPAHADPPYVALATHCWAHRPQDRPTASQVVAELHSMLETHGRT